MRGMNARRGGEPSGRGLALAGAGLAAIGLAWAVGIEPRLLDEAKVDARVPRLPTAWEGKRVAALGDFQVGVWYANPHRSSARPGVISTSTGG